MGYVIKTILSTMKNARFVLNYRNYYNVYFYQHGIWIAQQL